METAFEDGLCLSSAAHIFSYLRLLAQSDPRIVPNGPPPSSVLHAPNGVSTQDGDDDEDDRASSSDSDPEGYASAASVPSSPTPGPSRSSSPTPVPVPDAVRALPRALSLAIPPSELTPNFPTDALTCLLSAFAASLTHLRISHSESLLALDPSIPRALASLSSVTHISLSAVGPRASELVRDLHWTLHHAELNFDDAWVASLAASSSSSSQYSSTVFPDLPTGQSSGLPTPAPTPATTPAVSSLAAQPILPDPVSLLAHSMSSLRVLRASNALIVTVADSLRYPAVRTLTLRIAGIPTVTPLVHAFPGVTDLYVYTLYDGCGVRPILSPFASPQPYPTDSTQQSYAPLPALAATRQANRTSQLYSSFPPLSRLRGFPAGLCALGLISSVRHLEVGAVAPPLAFSARTETEAEMVRRLLADTRPLRVGLTLGRGWWVPQPREAGGSYRRRKEREALRTLFDVGDAEIAPSGWAGVKELVLRIDEVGRWHDVTEDLAAMLKPLAPTLATLVLRWDRTSVPFDRAPPDDDDDDAGHDPSFNLDPGSPGASAGRSPTLTPALHEHTETFARRLADELPALRYVCIDILRDAPAHVLPPSRPSSANAQEQARSPASIWSAEAQNGVAESVRRKLSPASSALDAKKARPHSHSHSPSPVPSPLPPSAGAAPPRRRTERRFWRVEREGEEGRWVCLDPLDDAKGRKILDAAGLSLEDVVRY